MRKVILYIAMSLDGYISDKSGDVDWLVGDGSDIDNPGSYPEFLQTVDTVMMGYSTYKQIVTKLSPQRWVYPGKTSYVLTHNMLPSSNEIIFTDKAMDGLIMELKSKTGKNIWICGGASIVNQLIDYDMIDQYWITVIPTILGGGTLLFGNHEKELPLRLIATRSYNGMTDLVYMRREKEGYNG